MPPRPLLAGACATAVLVGALTGPALAAPVGAVAATPTNAYSGFSTGTLEFVNAANLPPTDVARVGLGQSAAGVQLPGPLAAAPTTDQLKQPLLLAACTGKTAYGHASGANAGLLSAQTSEPQLEQTLVEATSPEPSTATGELLALPADPLATATVLPGEAVANTTAAGSCVVGKDLGRGTASIANATALNVGSPVVGLGATSESVSRQVLVAQGARYGLLSQTTQTLAPLTLFAGTPAALTITVLGPIQLSVSAGGVAGSSVVTYGVPGKTGTEPVVTITGGGQTQSLTADQVFGSGGFVIPLGIADITIGSPAHALTGLEGTAPAKAADGTSASAAADFLRISVPGRLATPGQDPLDGPLAPLNAVLNPVLSGLDPLLSQLQSALAGAGLDVADVRIGHLEGAAVVPLGGISCATDNPLDESRKDVSATDVTAGSTFTYALRIPNRGTTPITNVKVVDTYSAALQFVSSVPAPASRSRNTLTYQLGTLDPGEFATIVLTFRAPVGAAAGTVYRNDAVITGTYDGRTITQPVSATGPTVLTELVPGCDLSGSSKYASNTQVTTGETFGYFVNVFNSGDSDCTGVVVRDTLVNGVTFVSCTSSCTHVGQAVTWPVGTVRSGQSLVLAVLVKVTATTGTLPNAAVITPASGTGGDPSTAGPRVTTDSVARNGEPATVAVRELPRTGLPAGPAALGALGLLGYALLRRRLA